MSGNDEFPCEIFGDSSQFTNWVLYSIVMCHMTPEVSDFIPSYLEDTDKHIEVSDEHHNTAKQKGQVRIEMYENNRSFYRNVTQRTFGTRFMQQVIFNNYVNEFKTYFFIPQKVVHSVLWRK